MCFKKNLFPTCGDCSPWVTLLFLLLTLGQYCLCLYISGCESLFFSISREYFFFWGVFLVFGLLSFSLFMTKFGTFSSFSFLTRISIGEGLIRLTKLVCSVPVKISSLVIKTFLSSFLGKRCLLEKVSYNQDKYRGGTYQTG